MQVLDSLVEGMALLPDAADQQSYAWALLRYMSDGGVPEGLTPVALAMLTANRPALDNSRARARAGAAGRRKPAAPDAPKPAKEANPEQDGSKAITDAEQTDNKRESNAEQTDEQTRNEEEEEVEEVPPKGGTKKARPRFVPPTVDEVAAYAAERGAPGFNAERFCSYYASVGWKVGKKKAMSDWRASVRYWLARDGSGGGDAVVRDEYSGL